MKRFFTSIFALLLVCLTGQSVFAAQTTTPLSVSTVKVTDNKHIRITFSEAVDSDSIVLKVSKQSDNSSVKLDSIAAVADEKQSIDVTLDDALVEASSYTLTVIAGIAVSGATITDGASALLDFVTPNPLKIAGEIPPTLNAPSNPSAVMTESTTTTTKSSTKVDTTNTSAASETDTKGEKPEPTPTPTDELPLTGPNSIFFLFISVVIAYFFLRKKIMN